MASYFHQAGEAIGKTIKKWDLDGGHNWGNLVPDTAWGISPANWVLLLGEIVELFSMSIAPARLPPNPQFPRAREEELYKLQRRLSDSVL